MNTTIAEGHVEMANGSGKFARGAITSAYPKLNQQLHEQLVKYVDANSVDDTAEKLGMSSVGLNRILKEPSPRVRQATKDAIEKLVQGKPSLKPSGGTPVPTKKKTKVTKKPKATKKTKVKKVAKKAQVTLPAGVVIGPIAKLINDAIEKHANERVAQVKHDIKAIEDLLAKVKKTLGI